MDTEHPDEFVLLDCHAAGVGHHLSPVLVMSLPHGTSITLVREPANPYDKNAVRLDVCVPGSLTPDVPQKLGYVPAVRSNLVAVLLDHGYPMRGVVDYVDKGGATVGVALLMPKIAGKALSHATERVRAGEARELPSYTPSPAPTELGERIRTGIASALKDVKR